MANTDCLSVRISAILDSMGFCKHMIEFRINNTRYMDVFGALKNFELGIIITGGKADGTSLLAQGDTDIMTIPTGKTISGRHIDPPSPQHTVLYAEDRGVHPGYTWLRVEHIGLMDDEIGNSLFVMMKEHSVIALYLSSYTFNQLRRQNFIKWCPSGMQHWQISGPAQSVTYQGTENDNVYALSHADWPIQASQWMDRCRTNGWPPESIVTAMVQSGCHVVPKGFKGSPWENMEWCISFAVHVKTIVQLFNITQKHVYILLKLIAKDLRESNPDLQDLVTSYTMKTVALWQVELHHTKEWDRYHLIDRLMGALDFLKSCVEGLNLPAYFIPKNNLFDGKINTVTAAHLYRLLNDFLSQGSGCVLTFPSIQQQLQIMQIPDLRWSLSEHRSMMEMSGLILQCCEKFLTTDLSMKNVLHALSLIDLPDMKIHGSLTKGVSKMMKATLAYISIAKIKKTGMSNRRKYELCRPWLHIASANIGTDRMSGKVKFAGVLNVLGKTNKVIEALYSIKPRPPFGVCRKCHNHIIICEQYEVTKSDSDDIKAAITRLGRDKFVQECVSLDVRYTMEEMDIIPDVLKYELFHVPETTFSSDGAYGDPDMLRYYLLYKCHTEQGEEAKAQAAFMNLIRTATQEQFDPYMEYIDVALNVLGLCYLEKENYYESYMCFCRAMSLRPILLVEQRSTSTPWHLAVLASKLISRQQAGCSDHKIIEPQSSSKLSQSTCQAK